MTACAYVGAGDLGAKLVAEYNSISYALTVRNAVSTYQPTMDGTGFFMTASESQKSVVVDPTIIMEVKTFHKGVRLAKKQRATRAIPHVLQSTFEVDTRDGTNGIRVILTEENFSSFHLIFVTFLVSDEALNRSKFEIPLLVHFFPDFFNAHCVSVATYREALNAIECAREHHLKGFPGKRRCEPVPEHLDGLSLVMHGHFG